MNHKAQFWFSYNVDLYDHIEQNLQFKSQLYQQWSLQYDETRECPLEYLMIEDMTFTCMFPEYLKKYKLWSTHCLRLYSSVRSSASQNFQAVFVPTLRNLILSFSWAISQHFNHNNFERLCFFGDDFVLWQLFVQH